MNSYRERYEAVSKRGEFHANGTLSPREIHKRTTHLLGRITRQESTDNLHCQLINKIVTEALSAEAIYHNIRSHHDFI